MFPTSDPRVIHEEVGTWNAPKISEVDIWERAKELRGEDPKGQWVPYGWHPTEYYLHVARKERDERDAARVLDDA